MRVEVGWLCREQHGRRPVEFNTRSFVAGGPEPQEGGGLGRARTSGSEGAYGTKALTKRRSAWRRRWPRKSDFASFWLNYILAIDVRDDKIYKIHSLSSINLLYQSKYRSKFIAASSLFNATYASSVV